MAARRDGQFSLAFQPIVEALNGNLCAFEALMRWHHPIRGLISPSIFIPVAESSGLIALLGEWALRNACQQAISWPWAARVSVNISAAHVRSPAFASNVLAALSTSGLAPTCLELEITESVRLDASDEIVGVLNELRSFGIRVVLDDFGAGWSSLDMLRRFRFDGLKIDRCLVSDLPTNPRAVAIIRAIIRLASELDICVTAEGVEDVTQLQILRDLGCERLQGFLVGKPEPRAVVPSRHLWLIPA
ncbi:EAL domain-containing protein [Inquilinus limosus]|uniref:EAL domain-containing protein n=1 Tax=Inquilinus limosus TaxID=171674 RepID=UPI0023B8DAE7|nr:EAL domain-containing protein [Inquilinus limosus]